MAAICATSGDRREHLLELQAWLGLGSFGADHSRHYVEHLADLAQQTERGMLLAVTLVTALRQQKIIVPPIDVLERICAEALTTGNRRVYKALTADLPVAQKKLLENLLEPGDESAVSKLAWLRQPHGFPNPKHVLVHIERLRAIQQMLRDPV